MIKCSLTFAARSPYTHRLTNPLIHTRTHTHTKQKQKNRKTEGLGVFHRSRV